MILFLLTCTWANGQEQETPSKERQLPTISLAQGLMNFSGDVGYKKFGEPLLARSALQLEIEYPNFGNLALSWFFLYGRIGGNEKNYYRALNFKSTVMSGGMMVRYDFISRKNPNQFLIPFIGAGVEYISFKTKSDLLASNGKAYQYWSDGTIRDIAQTDPASDQSVILYRDYIYETDLRTANLDGLSDYPKATWGVPITAGVRLKISDRCSMHFSSAYHFTGTDLIDGISSQGSGIRKGNAQNDKFIYSSVSFRFSLSSKSNDRDYRGIDFDALVNEDADGDGIPDIRDDSSGTPLNNQVTADGKPFDKDNDGIPDYRDLEPNSAPDAVVNEQGITITEEMIEEKFRKDSLAALPAVIEYLQSYDKLTRRNPEVEKRWIEKNSAAVNSSATNPIPVIYRPIDTDKNGIITPKEISTAIDDYLAKKSTYSVSEFFDLIDYFFSQK